MQDLLNEEEFLQPKTYNPWKRFIVFYGIAFLNMGAVYFILQTTYIDNLLYLRIISIFLASLCLIMPFLMVFHTKKNIHSKKSTIYKGVSLLMLTYLLTFHILQIIEYPDYFWDFIDNVISNLRDLVIFLFYGFFCSFLITVINKRKLKKLKTFEINN